MTRNRRIIFGRLALVALIGAWTTWAAGQAAAPAPARAAETARAQAAGSGREGGHALARGIAHAQGARGMG